MAKFIDSLYVARERIKFEVNNQAEDVIPWPEWAHTTLTGPAESE